MKSPSMERCLALTLGLWIHRNCAAACTFEAIRARRSKLGLLRRLAGVVTSSPATLARRPASPTMPTVRWSWWRTSAHGCDADSAAPPARAHQRLHAAVCARDGLVAGPPTACRVRMDRIIGDLPGQADAMGSPALVTGRRGGRTSHSTAIAPAHDATCGTVALPVGLRHRRRGSRTGVGSPM
jgi:hypothetical protein